MPDAPAECGTADEAERLGASGIVIRWIVGFFIASLLMWIGSAPFVDSVMPYVYDEAVGCYTAPDDHVHRFRSEGRATTRFYQHGLTQPHVIIIRSSGELFSPVAIWGDSYVEGFRTEDQDKIAQQATALLKSDGGEICYGIGRSGRSVADYYHLMPAYETLLHPAAHVIVISSMRDVCPDGKSFVLEDGAYQLKQRPLNPSMQSLRRIVNHMRLEFAWNAMRSVMTGNSGAGLRTLRFRPGPVEAGQGPEGQGDAAITEIPEPGAWEFLLASLRARTQKPIAIIYGPITPRIKDGMVTAINPEQQTVFAFAKACKAHDITFIDLSQDFARLYVRTGRFPRGFDNGIPAQGHWNRDANRICAEAIANYVRSRRALHTD